MKFIYSLCLGMMVWASLNGELNEIGALIERAIPPDTHLYVIPDNHPIKQSLDEIFSRPHVLSSYKSMKKHGFRKIFKCKAGLKVASHPKIKGYLIKTYLDDFKGEEVLPFLIRAKGARLVRKSIDAHKFGHLLKVPQKWLYPIPEIVKSPRRYLLVVEDMHVYPWETNLDWFMVHIHVELLYALFVVITENHLIDSVYPDNIPFSSDGCLNFIDIEHFHAKHQRIKYEALTPYLAPEMQIAWEYLIDHY